MSDRMFKGLCIIGGLNFLLYFGSYSSLTSTPSSGPEGIGTAFMAMASLFLSFILTAFALNRLYVEIFQKIVARRTLLATLAAASPLLLWLLSAAFRMKTHG